MPTGHWFARATGERRSAWWKDLRLFGLLGITLTIPVVLATGPLIGYMVGNWLDRQWQTSPGMVGLGVTVGSMASCIEVYRILRWVSRLEKHKTGRS